MQKRKLIEHYGTTGPCVTKAMVNSCVKLREYLKPKGSRVTICALHLHSGYVVIGKAACVNPDDYSEALQKQLALDDARRQLTELLAFQLRESIQAELDDEHWPQFPFDIALQYLRQGHKVMRHAKPGQFQMDEEEVIRNVIDGSEIALTNDDLVSDDWGLVGDCQNA